MASAAHPREKIEAVAKEVGQAASSAAVAAALDSQDELSSFRDRFHIPASPVSPTEPALYLCGNSLGLQPKSTAAMIEDDLRDWRNLGVEGHFRGKRPWVDVETRVQSALRDILGARHDHEVIAMNSLTVNVHLMMVSFFRPQGERRKILIEAKAFPSDYFAVRSQLAFHGLDPDECLIEAKPREGKASIDDDDVVALIEKHGAEISLVWLGCVQYYTGQAFDMERITRAGHAAGCTVGFDLAHGAGNLPLRLHDWGVDVATFCSYKYLNSGPGATAGIFVHDRHANAHAEGRPMFTGWWGHERESRFEMGHDFVPLKGAPAWQLSNPAVLPMTSLLASVEIFAEATMERLRAKSLLLTAYLELLIDERCAGKVEILTPRDVDRRGCQLSLRFVGESLDAVSDALAAAGVICDKRRPDVIRAAPTPLYNTFTEVHRFVDIITKVVNAKA